MLHLGHVLWPHISPYTPTTRCAGWQKETLVVLENLNSKGGMTEAATASPLPAVRALASWELAMTDAVEVHLVQARQAKRAERHARRQARVLGASPAASFRSAASSPRSPDTGGSTAGSARVGIGIAPVEGVTEQLGSPGMASVGSSRSMVSIQSVRVKRSTRRKKSSKKSKRHLADRGAASTREDDPAAAAPASVASGGGAGEGQPKGVLAIKVKKRPAGGGSARSQPEIA